MPKVWNPVKGPVGQPLVSAFDTTRIYVVRARTARSNSRASIRRLVRLKTSPLSSQSAGTVPIFRTGATSRRTRTESSSSGTGIRRRISEVSRRRSTHSSAKRSMVFKRNRTCSLAPMVRCMSEPSAPKPAFGSSCRNTRWTRLLRTSSVRHSYESWGRPAEQRRYLLMAPCCWATASRSRKVPH